MAATLLAELERRDALPREYWILEVSADLRARQRETLAASVPQLLARIRWLDRLPDPPFDGVVVANEVLDALPVERFVKREGDTRALGCDRRGGRLVPEEARAGPALEDAVRHVEADLGAPLADGYESEINLGLHGWIASLAAAMRRG
jgi:SAM-dependent MidA family methyltransferase